MSACGEDRVIRAIPLRRTPRCSSHETGPTLKLQKQLYCVIVVVVGGGGGGGSE